MLLGEFLSLQKDTVESLQSPLMLSNFIPDIISVVVTYNIRPTGFGKF
jgi:hypothetical protein